MKDNFTATWQDLARQEILLWGLGVGSFQYLNVFDRCAHNLSTYWHRKGRLMAHLLIILGNFTLRYRLQLHQGLAAPRGGRHSSAVEKLRPRGRFGGRDIAQQGGVHSGLVIYYIYDIYTYIFPHILKFQGRCRRIMMYSAPSNIIRHHKTS